MWLRTLCSGEYNDVDCVVRDKKDTGMTLFGDEELKCGKKEGVCLQRITEIWLFKNIVEFGA